MKTKDGKVKKKAVNALCHRRYRDSSFSRIQVKTMLENKIAENQNYRFKFDQHTARLSQESSTMEMSADVLSLEYEVGKLCPILLNLQGYNLPVYRCHGC